MRGKCATCEFFDEWETEGHYGHNGSCRIRSVGNDEWPPRTYDEWCGEHKPIPIQADPTIDLPDVQNGERVEKSMGEPS